MKNLQNFTEFINEGVNFNKQETGEDWIKEYGEGYDGENETQIERFDVSAKDLKTNLKNLIWADEYFDGESEEGNLFYQGMKQLFSSGKEIHSDGGGFGRTYTGKVKNVPVVQFEEQGYDAYYFDKKNGKKLSKIINKAIADGEITASGDY